MLWAFHNILDLEAEYGFSSSFLSRLLICCRIKRVSDVKSMLAMLTKPEFNIPKEYIDVAKAMEARFAAQNWGIEEKVLKAEAGDNDNDNDDRPRKRVKTTSASTSTQQVARGAARRAPSDHVIFGSQGIMRGILVSKGSTTSYSLDMRFPRKSFKRFGANGLTVGDVRILRSAVLTYKLLTLF